jgi:hypothetical protein
VDIDLEQEEEVGEVDVEIIEEQKKLGTIPKVPVTKKGDLKRGPLLLFSSHRSSHCNMDT